MLALNTKSRLKALKYSQVICQRLDELWLPMRLDALGFGNVIANDVKSLPSPKLSEAMQPQREEAWQHLRASVSHPVALLEKSATYNFYP